METEVEIMTIERILTEFDAVRGGSLSLVVGRAFDQGGDLRRLRLSDAAADAFRSYGDVARAAIADGVAIEYTALTELGADQFLLIEDEESLDELADLRSVAQSVGDLQPVSPRDLDASIGFYAIGLGEAPERIVLIRRTDPRVLAKPGRFLAIARERLDRVDEQVFTFSEEFDLVIGDQWAVVFNQVAFERLARETGVVERHVSSWIGGITDAFPMEQEDVDKLRETALRDSRTWRRLRDIKRRGHLKGIQLAQVTEYASAVGLNPDSIVRDGKLHFDPQERFGFLHLLSEDLYRGALTGERFESQRKASMG